MRALLVACLAVSVAAVAEEDLSADLQLEQNLHRQYKNFAATPTPEEDWSEATSKKSSNQTYSIQKGDTLSDLSLVLFGDLNFWPKIWSLNNQAIENPHIIMPGQTLEFFPGTASSSPSFRILGSKATKLSNRTDPLDIDWDFSYSVPQATRPEVKAKAAPESFPSWSFRKQEEQKREIEFDRFEVKIDEPAVMTPFFLSEQILKSQAVIKSLNGERPFVSTESLVTLESSGGETMSETQFHILGAAKRWKDPSTGRVMYFYPVIAEGQLVKDKIFKVTQMLDKDFNNDWVVRSGPAPKYQVNKNAPVTGLAANVLKLDVFGLGSKFYGPGQLLLLSAGEESGVKAGDKVDIVSAISDSDSARKGQVAVVFITAKYSLAKVIQASDEIKPGDRSR